MRTKSAREEAFVDTLVQKQKGVADAMIKA